MASPDTVWTLHVDWLKCHWEYTWSCRCNRSARGPYFVDETGRRLKRWNWQNKFWDISEEEGREQFRKNWQTWRDNLTRNIWHLLNACSLNFKFYIAQCLFGSPRDVIGALNTHKGVWPQASSWMQAPHANFPNVCCRCSSILRLFMTAGTRLRSYRHTTVQLGAVCIYTVSSCIHWGIPIHLDLRRVSGPETESMPILYLQTYSELVYRSTLC